jgi:hypothetical protein
MAMRPRVAADEVEAARAADDHPTRSSSFGEAATAIPR